MRLNGLLAGRLYNFSIRRWFRRDIHFLVVFACDQMLREKWRSPIPGPPMQFFSTFCLYPFLGAWLGYHVGVEWTEHGRKGLNSRMNAYRDIWMMRMLERDVRIVDTQIMASLQNGTAFFASTSLIAIGGALTLMRSTDDLLAVASTLPFGVETSRALWELKTIGLAW